jgi:elongator complex protein 2
MTHCQKGTTVDQSAIRIWDTTTWREKAVLKAHSLSTIQLAFSHDDKYLLGVSRDRTYSVFSTKKNGK